MPRDFHLGRHLGHSLLLLQWTLSQFTFNHFSWQHPAEILASRLHRVSCICIYIYIYIIPIHYRSPTLSHPTGFPAKYVLSACILPVPVQYYWKNHALSHVPFQVFPVYTGIHSFVVDKLSPWTVGIHGIVALMPQMRRYFCDDFSARHSLPLVTFHFNVTLNCN